MPAIYGAYIVLDDGTLLKPPTVQVLPAATPETLGGVSVAQAIKVAATYVPPAIIQAAPAVGSDSQDFPWQRVNTTDGKVYTWDRASSEWRWIPDPATAAAMHVSLDGLTPTDALPSPVGPPWPDVLAPETLGGVPVAQAVAIASTYVAPAAPVVSLPPAPAPAVLLSAVSAAAPTEELGGVSVAQAVKIATAYISPVQTAAAAPTTVEDAAAADAALAQQLADANAPDLSNLPPWDLIDPFGVRLLASTNPPLKGLAALNAIAQACADYGIAPRACVAAALHEGSGGGIGDNGDAYGPFQDHLQSTGRPFSGVDGRSSVKVNAWAWSDNGISYSVRQMATGQPSAKGLEGHAAVYAIVYGYERPGDEAGAYRTRADEYDHLVQLRSGWVTYAAPLLKGPIAGGATATIEGATAVAIPAAHVPAGVLAQWRGLLDQFGTHVPEAHSTLQSFGLSLTEVFK